MDGGTIRSHNSLAPPPHPAHQTVHTWLWDGIAFLNEILCWSLSHIQHVCVQLGCSLGCWQATLHPLYSHILWVVCSNPGTVSIVILEDGVKSQIVEK